MGFQFSLAGEPAQPRDQQKLREEVYKRYGLRKGGLSKAIEEAIRDWINKEVS